MKPIIVVQCGAGSRSEHKDAAEKAGKEGYEVLLKGGKAIDAVERSISVLEDDDRFNAGTGSKMCLDGTVQMDAGIMDSEGKCGAVACIMNVKNPIKVARKVADTPHILLAGEGAEKFARKLGFQYYDVKTPKSVELFEKVKRMLAAGEVPRYAEKWKEFSKHWVSTVGAVARDMKGGFSAGVSSGGTSFMLDGRIGDSSLLGCGFYAGRKGAVSATGIGEDIMRKFLSKWVYDKMDEGKSAKKASNLGIILFEEYIPVGVIAVSDQDFGITCNRDMAYWASDLESKGSDREL